ncbi:MAG TPA: glycosyltransferase family 2 protein [Leptolyngbyaceae cyanobacterium]
MSTVDVLIPTYNRPTALAVTLAGLCAQTYRDFSVTVSDQTEDTDMADLGEIQAVTRVLELHGHRVNLLKHLPRQGIAEQRNFLLSQATAPYVLFMDDDVMLESWAVGNLVSTIQKEGCGLVGMPLIGPSFAGDVRPHEQKSFQFWEGPIQPEVIKPDTPAWERWRLHNAANPLHIQQRLNLTPDQPRPYKVAWIGGCTLFDRAKLLEIGGFSFWEDLPPTSCGEDVLAQQRVMARYGGCGILPSGAYHQEVPTTIHDRSKDAHHFLPVEV